MNPAKPKELIDVLLELRRLREGGWKLRLRATDLGRYPPPLKLERGKVRMAGTRRDVLLLDAEAGDAEPVPAAIALLEKAFAKISAEAPEALLRISLVLPGIVREYPWEHLLEALPAPVVRRAYGEAGAGVNKLPLVLDYHGAGPQKFQFPERLSRFVDRRADIVCFDLEGEVPPLRAAGEPHGLLVHQSATGGTAAGWNEYVHRTIENGRDAVLVVRSTNPEASKFLELFYQKVLDNWPMDQALAHASQTSGLPRRDLVFGARDRGELVLLPSLAALRTARAPQIPFLESHTPVFRGPDTDEDDQLYVPRAQSVARELAQEADQKLDADLEQRVDRITADTFTQETIRRLEQELAEMRTAQSKMERSIAVLRRAAGAKERQLPTRFTRVWTSPKPDAIDLHVRITPENIPDSFGAALDETSLRPLLDQGQPVKLDVLVIAPEGDFEISVPRGQITLPRMGESDTFTTQILPLGEGRGTLRVEISFRNVLLQAVEVTGIGNPETKYKLDWAVTPDFHQLERIQPAQLGLSYGQSQGETHWVGVRANGPGGERLELNAHKFAPSAFATIAKNLREALENVRGRRQFNFASADEKKRSEWLIDLALAGYRAFDALFRAHRDQRALKQPGLISIARCGEDETTLPWAALYDLELSQGHREEMTLCPTFLEARSLERCLSSERCPLNKTDHKIVCPFGFWGFRHQIEQPLGALQNIQELTDPSHGEGWLTYKNDAGIGTIFACDPDLLGERRAHWVNICGIQNLTAQFFDDRDKILRLLQEGNSQIYYLYCHGEVTAGFFALKLKANGRPSPLMAADLRLQRPLPDRPGWLAIFNACDSMAIEPKSIHGFLDALRRQRALGVIGTEIPIYNTFAEPFAVELLRAFSAVPATIGDAVLRARLHFLRELNPLGLAYTHYSFANLHLHPSSGCKLPSCREAQARSR